MELSPVLTIKIDLYPNGEIKLQRGGIPDKIVNLGVLEEAKDLLKKSYESNILRPA